MSVHLKREIELLKKEILALGAMVEENVWRAVKSVEERDADLARQALERDEEIDRREVAVEEECLKALALHQPVANDLRFIIAMLKIDNDLERIGDMAVNIAKSSLALAGQPRLEVCFDLRTMSDKARSMLKRSLDAVVNTDADLARQVRAADEEVDDLDRQFCHRVKEAIKAHPHRLDALLAMHNISRSVERIADLASNIAEDTIYMVKGEIVRHTAETEK
ncbi:MAG TPA: phosphate signaling complex protein PhoU [Candidatus Brocadiia bacterium]|nr:phosphate signaling complex protein PhoU [Candidatus Brocadiia bacterium]